MSDRSKLTIRHPELGVSQIIPSALPVWLERGWSADLEGSAPAEVPSARPSDYADVAPSDETASTDLIQTTNVAEAGS